MEYGLLGEKLGHSFSPRIHKALKGYDYDLLPTAPDKVEALLRERAFRGINVTIPYKQTVIPLCDHIAPRALAIGAVNTVVNRDGELFGDNTDIDGLLYLARRAGVEIAGKKVLILGSGGTSRTARFAAEELGAREIVVISRRGEHTYENLFRHVDAQIIVNTTPVGMYPNCGVSAVALADFPALEGVLDVVYNPLRTELIRQAEERGLPCSSGLPMLVAQAARACELFTGDTVDDGEVERVLAELHGELENVVLVGMPGCGKSRVGALLAELLGRELVDLDTEIEKKAGMDIPRIFSLRGEEGFRRIETEVVRETGARTGLVISTGGGVVTRPENRAPLRQNGRVVHLLRPLHLLAKEGRPLSLTTPAQEMWEKRAPLYAAFADVAVDNVGTPEETAKKIVKELKMR